MNVDVLERRFGAIGARAEIAGTVRGGFRIDVRDEVFCLHCSGQGAPDDVEVIDADRNGRHLLLLIRQEGLKSKFLCGRDERHWFVAVATAKVALQPKLVRDAVDRLKPKDRFHRRNPAYVRQGEWFFVPEPHLDTGSGVVHLREPLSRGGGTPHVLERAFRRAGEPVWVRGAHILDEVAYRALPEPRSGRWRQPLRDPELFAKGAIRHPDHTTIVLGEWHRVLMNTEQRARAMQHVAFLD